MIQRKINLKNIKSKFGYGNDNDKTELEKIPDKKKYEFQFNSFIQSISEYNSNVSKLIDIGLNLKTLDVIFDIKYLDYQDELHKLFPNANLQSSKGGAPSGGLPPIPTPEQLGNMIDELFGTKMGSDAKRREENIATLTNYINRNNTHLGQLEALEDYFTTKKLRSDMNLKKALAKLIFELQEIGIIDFNNVSDSIALSEELIESFTTGILKKSANPSAKFLKALRFVINLKNVGSKGGQIKYNDVTYKTKADYELLKKIINNEIQDYITKAELTPEQNKQLNTELGLTNTSSIDDILKMLEKESVPFDDDVFNMGKKPTTTVIQKGESISQIKPTIQTLFTNIMNMLSTSSDFVNYMKKNKKSYIKEQIDVVINYILNRLSAGGDRSYYVIAEYIKKWLKVVAGVNVGTASVPLPNDPNTESTTKVEGEVRKPTPDLIYDLVASEEMDEATRNNLIQLIISINDNYKSSALSSSSETQEEGDKREMLFLRQVVRIFESIKSEIETVNNDDIDNLDWKYKPNTIWENIFGFLTTVKDSTLFVKNVMQMRPKAQADHITELAKDIYKFMKDQPVQKNQPVQKKQPVPKEQIQDETEGVGAIDQNKYDPINDTTRLDRTNIENFEGNIEPNKDVYEPEDGAPLPSTPPISNDEASAEFNRMVNRAGAPPPPRFKTSDWKNSTMKYNEAINFDDDVFNKGKWPGEDENEDYDYEGDEGDEGDEGNKGKWNGSNITDMSDERELSHNSLLAGLNDMFNEVYSDSDRLEFGNESDEYYSDGSTIYGSDDDLPELELTPEQQGIFDDFREIIGQGGEQEPNVVRTELGRMIRRLRNGTGRIQLRRRLSEQLNKIRARINGSAIRFNWSFIDPVSGISWLTEEEAVDSLLQIEMDRIYRLPRESEERRLLANQTNVNSLRNIIKKRLQRVIVIEYNRTPPGGGGDPDDPDDFPNDPVDEGDINRRRRVIPVTRVFKLLAAILATLASGFTIAEGVKWLDGWMSGDNVEIPKDNTPVLIPKKPDDKKPKPKPPSTDDSILPKKFLTIGHTEWFDSVGLSAVIDTYNGFVNEYNKAREDGTISDKDLTFMNKNIREYYDKFAKVTNTPLLSDLQEAKKRYDALRAQYDDALENGMDINNISVIYTELRKSMTYLDRMTDQFLKMEGGVFGTYKNKNDPDVTVDDADSNIRLVSAPTMDKQARKNKLKSPSDFILSKGMKERIERKLNRKGFGDGVLQEEKLFNDFSIVTPPPIREHSSLTIHNKRHEIMQYAKARSTHAPIKTRRLTKMTGQKPRLNNVVQFDDILDDAYYNNPDSTKLQNPYQTKSDNIQQFHKSKLYNPEYSLQKAFENKNNKNMTTDGDMIRTGPYENVNKDQYYQLGTIQYDYNEELNKYPMTRQKPMTIDKSNPKQIKPIRHRRIPNSYSLK